MSNHKRNWVLIWTAIGSIAAGVLAIPPLIEGARSVIVGSLSDKVNRIEQDVKEVKGDVKLIMMHQGIAERSTTNHVANGN